MVTADWLATSSKHVFAEPDSESNLYGVAGGCLDAPACIPAGYSYWYKFQTGGGINMQRAVRREQ